MFFLPNSVCGGTQPHPTAMHRPPCSGDGEEALPGAAGAAGQAAQALANGNRQRGEGNPCLKASAGGGRLSRAAEEAVGKGGCYRQRPKCRHAVRGHGCDDTGAKAQCPAIWLDSALSSAIPSDCPACVWSPALGMSLMLFSWCLVGDPKKTCLLSAGMVPGLHSRISW